MPICLLRRLFKLNFMENKDIYKAIAEEVKKYGQLKWDYAKLVGIEKLSIFLSAIAVAGIVTILVLVALFYFASAFQTWLSFYVEEWVAYIIVAAIFLLLGLLVVVFKKSLILDPVCRLVSKIFIDK